eukprot:42768-Pelagomonas_calceolata.AAC.2
MQPTTGADGDLCADFPVSSLYSTAEGTWTDGEGQPLSKRAAHKLELQKKWQARKEAKQRAKQKKREQQQQQQQQQGGKSESGQAEVVEGTAAPQQAKKAKKEKQKEGKQQEEKQQRQEEGNVDLSAWKAFALHPLLEQALGQLVSRRTSAVLFLLCALCFARAVPHMIACSISR